MAFKAKEIVEAEALENPEMFMRNLLGDFSEKGTRHGGQAMGQKAAARAIPQRLKPR